MGDISTQSGLGKRVFDGPIEFPSLGINVNPPKNFFGTFAHWYGIIIAVGLVLAILLCLHIARKRGVLEDTIFDIVIFGAPVGIICARAYYVIFRWDYYKHNLSEIVKIWEGGIAIYGAIIGAVATVFVYCKIKRINPFKVLDISCVGLVLGQAVGRWGNFVNREAFGAPATSSVPWRMKLYTDATMTTWAEVHPTFLYESLWNFGVLFLLLKLTPKKKYEGQIFWTYVLLYGAGRFWIEGLRLDSLYLGNFRVSQIVALVTMVLAVVMLIVSSKKVENAQSKVGNA